MTPLNMLLINQSSYLESSLENQSRDSHINFKRAHLDKKIQKLEQRIPNLMQRVQTLPSGIKTKLTKINDEISVNKSYLVKIARMISNEKAICDNVNASLNGELVEPFDGVVRDIDSLYYLKSKHENRLKELKKHQKDVSVRVNDRLSELQYDKQAILGSATYKVCKALYATVQNLNEALYQKVGFCEQDIKSASKVLSDVQLVDTQKREAYLLSAKANLVKRDCVRKLNFYNS